MEMDIHNETERPVVCVDNDDHTWGGNDHASQHLVVGQVYHVECVEVHSYHTKVYLEEFPGLPFNSVAFAEAALGGGEGG